MKLSIFNKAMDFLVFQNISFDKKTVICLIAFYVGSFLLNQQRKIILVLFLQHVLPQVSFLIFIYLFKEFENWMNLNKQQQPTFQLKCFYHWCHLIYNCIWKPMVSRWNFQVAVSLYGGSLDWIIFTVPSTLSKFMIFFLSSWIMWSLLSSV